MRAAPVASEPRSATGRVIRPAVRTSPSGVRVVLEWCYTTRAQSGRVVLYDRSIWQGQREWSSHHSSIPAQ
eukprot:5252033-Prymnesium_polylepis.2